MVNMVDAKWLAYYCRACHRPAHTNERVSDEAIHIWAIPVLKVSYRKWDIAQASDVPQNHQAVEEGLPCNYVQASPLAEEANE